MSDPLSDFKIVADRMLNDVGIPSEKFFSLAPIDQLVEFSNLESLQVSTTYPYTSVRQVKRFVAAGKIYWFAVDDDLVIYAYYVEKL